MSRRALAVILPLVLAAGCVGPRPAGAPSAAPAGSGVRGAATVDAGCPVLEPGAACPRRPLAARVWALRDGREVAAVVTGADGRFAIELPPGDYELRARNLTGRAVPVAAPVTVAVPAGAYAEVRLEFDSGVRGAPR